MTSPDHELDGFLAESLGGLEARIESSGRGLDFLDAMQRAHALAPEVVTQQAVAEAQSLAPVVDIRSSQDETPEDDELDFFISEVKTAVHDKVLDHQLRPVPTIRRPGRGRGPLRAIGLAVGAVAAVALGWLALGDATLLSRHGNDAPTEQAVDSGVDLASAEGHAVQRKPTRARASKSKAEAVVPPEPEPETEEIVEIEEAPEEVAPEPEPRHRATTSHKGPRQGKDDRLRALLDRAEAQWRAGDVHGAEDTLGQLLRKGGHSRHVQSAYADLFLLAHQAGDDNERRRLWKSYLRRFPRGRYADDARAGLCRTAAADQTNRCWDAYLDDFENGSYRAEATRAMR
jgi:hypothetical protein